MGASVLGGFWETNAGGVLNTIHTTSSINRTVSQKLAKYSGMPMRAVANALTGAVAGGSASKTLSRVAHSVELGGVRQVETINMVNITTTAQDVTNVKNDLFNLSTKTYNPNPPANLDGNPLGTR